MMVYPGRFAAIYAALAVCLLGSITAAVTFAMTTSTRHQVAAVRSELGDTNLTRLADKAIASAAQAQGFAVVKIRVQHVVVHGDDAVVTARVTVTDGLTEQTVTLKVAFSRSVWSVQGITA